MLKYKYKWCLESRLKKILETNYWWYIPNGWNKNFSPYKKCTLANFSHWIFLCLFRSLEKNFQMLSIFAQVSKNNTTFLSAKLIGKSWEKTRRNIKIHKESFLFVTFLCFNVFLKSFFFEARTLVVKCE